MTRIPMLLFAATSGFTQYAYGFVQQEADFVESNDLERPRYHLVHDANHLGQILYIRQLQGLPLVME